MTNPSGYYTSIYSGEEIDDAIGKLAELGDIVAENIPISETDSTTIAQALEKKADKVSDAVSGNLASLGATGDLQDSGKKPGDFAPAPLTANLTLYVNAATGSDSNPGTQLQPYATIQAAINSVTKNIGNKHVTINIADGVYNENIVIAGFWGAGDGTAPFGLYGTGGVQINGDVTIISNTTVYLSVISISGMLRIWYADAQLNRVSITADTANWAADSLFGNLWAYKCTITNPTGNGLKIGGTAYLDAITLNVQNVGVTVGNVGTATPALCVCGGMIFTAGTNFQKVSGGAVIQNGVLV